MPTRPQGKDYSPQSNKSRVSVRSDQSSIDQIITDFSRKIDSIRQSQQDSSCFQEYRPEPELLHPHTPQHVLSSQSGRNSQGLPLDSFEERPNIRLRSEMSQSYSSPPRERNEIWDCPEMELKEDFLEQLREGTEKFELKNDSHTVSAFNSPPSNKLEVELESVSLENKKLYETVVPPRKVGVCIGDDPPDVEQRGKVHKRARGEEPQVRLSNRRESRAEQRHHSFQGAGVQELK